MVARDPSPHARFVAAVRRRIWMARALDMAGTTAGGLAVAASVAMACGRPVAVAPLGALAVVVWVARLVRRRPTLIAAAALADAHYDWRDLLSSAIATRAVDDPFAATVRATADAQCRTVRPSAVPIPRLGRRGWVAIASVVVIATVAALAAQRHPSTDASSPDRAVVAVLTADADAAPAPAPPADQPTPTPRRTGADEMTLRNPAATEEDSPTRAKSSPSHSHADHRSTAAGTGGGAASSPREVPIDSPSIASSTSTVKTGPIAAAGGRAGPPPAAGPDAPPGTAAAASPSPAVPPWRSAGWPDARRAADSAVAAGTVPPRDRELVRAYFDRADDSP